MAQRKSFLLRIDPSLFDALRRWADDDLRSLNGQIEFVLRRGLQAAGRLRSPMPPEQDESPGEPEPPASPDPAA